MSKDKALLYIFYFVAAGLLFIFIPRKQFRHGILAFLFKQIVTWLVGLFVVEKGLIKYPIREFKKAYKGSFAFEYFLYPSLCAIFNVNYPEHRNRFIKFLYINFHTGILTLSEVMIEKYTNLIKYVKWKWYWSYLTIGITYYISRQFYRWFFKEEFKQRKNPSIELVSVAPKNSRIC